LVIFVKKLHQNAVSAARSLDAIFCRTRSAGLLVEMLADDLRRPLLLVLPQRRRNSRLCPLARGQSAWLIFAGPILHDAMAGWGVCGTIRLVSRIALVADR
jgi:hypothetical protein